MSQSHTKKNTVSEKSRKAPYFNIRWGKDAGFNKQIDRAAYETAHQSQAISQQISEQILTAYRTGGNTEVRHNWMNNLAHEALAFLAVQRGIMLRAMEQEAQRHQAAKVLLEEMFDLLQLYSYDFNASAIWTSLQVTCTKPAFVTEVLRYNKLREPIEKVTTFRARLSTRFLSLVIVGRKDRIELRLLPVEEVIGLTRAESVYEPFLTIESQEVDGEYTWKVGNQELTPGSVETICMELFTMLIDQTKLEAAENHAC